MFIVIFFRNHVRTAHLTKCPVKGDPNVEYAYRQNGVVLIHNITIINVVVEQPGYTGSVNHQRKYVHGNFNTAIRGARICILMCPHDQLNRFEEISPTISGIVDSLEGMALSVALYMFLRRATALVQSLWQTVKARGCSKSTIVPD